MKVIIKISEYFLLSGYLILILATIPISSYAQNAINTLSSQEVMDTSYVVIDTSSSQDLLIEPTIVLTSSVIEPDCHTYTGCGLIVVKKSYYHKPIHYKIKRRRIYHQPCCVIGGCFVRPVIYP